MTRTPADAARFTTGVFDEIVAAATRRQPEMRSEQQPLYFEHRSVYTAKPASTNQVLQTAYRFDMRDRFQHAVGYVLHINRVKFKVFSFSGHTCAYYR